MTVLLVLFSRIFRSGRALTGAWLLLGLVAASPAHSQQALPAPSSSSSPARRIAPDTSRTSPRLRAPVAERLQQLRGQHDFQYVEVKSEQSGWDLFWLRLLRWLSELLETPAGHVTWKYGFYAVLVGALVFAVLKLLQVDLTRAFGRAPRQAALSYDTETEDLHALDLDTLLTQAEADRNYRLAVRLGYLRVLRQLSDKELIQWKPDKTNHDYLFELPNGPLPAAFRELTRQFEYVWYGEQDDLTADDYARVSATRQGFQRLLSSSAKAA